MAAPSLSSMLIKRRRNCEREGGRRRRRRRRRRTTTGGRRTPRRTSSWTWSKKVRDFVKVCLFFVCGVCNRETVLWYSPNLSLFLSLLQLRQLRKSQRKKGEERSQAAKRRRKERKKKKSKNDDGEGGGHGQHLRGLHTRVVNLAIILRLEGNLHTHLCSPGVPQEIRGYPLDLLELESLPRRFWVPSCHPRLCSAFAAQWGLWSPLWRDPLTPFGVASGPILGGFSGDWHSDRNCATRSSLQR